MTRFFFWNFNTRARIAHPASVVARTALAHDADLIVLAENKVHPSLVLEELNRQEAAYHYPEFQHERFAIFTRFPGAFLEPFQDGRRMSVRRLRLPGRIEILIAVVHFPDRRNHSPTEQRSLCFEMARFLSDAEARAGHRRTILVGDFNMNPFDEGMVDANGFGAMMTKDLVQKCADRGPDEPPRFYNPMWGRMGDMSEGPPGTYYHRQRNRTNIYWHLLDQVLIRPDLLDAFIGRSLKILDKGLSESGEVDFLREQRTHWNLTVSDHLPILFTMDLPGGLFHEQPS